MKKLVLILIATMLTSCASINDYKNTHETLSNAVVIGIQNTTLTVDKPNLLGAALGGVGGGLVGSRIGGGNGKKVFTVLGALGGAYAGSQYNSKSTVSGYIVTIKTENNEIIDFDTDKYLNIGQAVKYKRMNDKIVVY